MPCKALAFIKKSGPGEAAQMIKGDRIMRRTAALILALAMLAGMMTLCLSGCSKTAAGTIRGTQDINSPDFRLGVETGSAAADEAAAAFPQADFQFFSFYTDAIAALQAGKIDGLYMDKVVLDEYCRQDDSLTTIRETCGGSDIAACIAQGNDELLAKVNAVLRQFREDGTLDDLERRWIEAEDRSMPELEAPESPAGTLRILTCGDVCPFSYVGADGELLGLDIELGMRIACALGMDWSFQTVTFSGLIPALASGKGDIVLAEVNVTGEREKEAYFSEPYYRTSGTVLVKKERYAVQDTTFSPTDEEKESFLATARIAVLSGSVPEIYATEHYPNATILNFDSRTDQIAAVSAGKADCALGTETQAKILVRRQEGFQYSTNPLYSNPASFIVSKDNPGLLEAVNGVIREMDSDGTLEAVYKKWVEDGNYTMEDVPQCGEGNVLRVAVSSSSEPFCFVSNNRLIGMECELACRIGYALGMRVEYVDMSFSGFLPAVAGGKADIAAGLTYTEERAKSVSFSEPYYYENITYERRAPAQAAAGRSAADRIRESFAGTFVTEGRWRLFVQGIGVTILISVCSYLLGTALGLLLCLMLGSKSALRRRIAAGYGKIVTGIPILVWLMILYYMVFRSMDLPGVLVAILGFGLECGAALSGVFKTGLDSVDSGQIEAASALGFGYRETFRRIIFPQAAAHVFDLYSGHFVSLVKSTSIVGYIAITDLTKVSDIVRSRTYQPFFPLIATALLYFGITEIFLVLLRAVRKRLNPKNRKHILKGVKTR